MHILIKTYIDEEIVTYHSLNCNICAQIINKLTFFLKKICDIYI